MITLPYKNISFNYIKLKENLILWVKVEQIGTSNAGGGATSEVLLVSVTWSPLIPVRARKETTIAGTEQLAAPVAKYAGTRYFQSVLATSNAFNTQYTRPKVITIHLIRDVNDMGLEFDIGNVYMTMTV